MTRSSEAAEKLSPPRSQVGAKCVVWDLDNTLWEGVLLEGDTPRLRPEVAAILEALDARGILNSVASRNDHSQAHAALLQLQVAHYFLEPQITFGAKSAAVRRIATALNIGIDTVVFVDDDPFERAEVSAALPEVRCFDAAHVGALLSLLELEHVQITEESRGRREMYQAEGQRKEAEQSFSGTNEDFLRSLGMVIRIAPASDTDLERAHELTARTSQLNSCGRIYSRLELDRFRTSATHRLLMVGLEDRFGSYGRIGLVLLENGPHVWTLKLLLTSCRVMSRGIGAVILHYLLAEARRAGVRFAAEFVPTERNRIMMVMYRFAGLKKVAEEDGVTLLEHDLTDIQPVPEYIKLLVEPG